MSTINREAYEQLIQQDLEWLHKQRHSLERNHIECIVRDSVEMYYPSEKGKTSEAEACARCGAPLLPHGQCSRFLFGCQRGRGES